MTGQSMRVTHNRSHIVTRRLVKTESQASVLQQLTPNSGMLTRVDRHLSSKSTVRISEPKSNVKMHFVVKTGRPDPEPGIPDKWDKITLKESVTKKNRPDTEASGYLASGYLRVHCKYHYAKEDNSITFGKHVLGHQLKNHRWCFVIVVTLGQEQYFNCWNFSVWRMLR